MNEEQAAALRLPFPANCIGKLPRGGQQLDFVGHANVTDRLLTVDPSWTWEPMALDADGLPKYDRNGGLWIRLTVCGVTRPGYGDGPDPKQLVSDALRNAAMRFGVALDLWARGGLESEVDAARQQDEDRKAQSSADYDARQGGWEDEADRRAADQQLMGVARSLSGERKELWRAWLEESGYRRPYTRPEWEKAWDELSRLAGSEEDPF